MTYHVRSLVTAFCLLCLLASPLPTKAQTPAKPRKPKQTAAAVESPPEHAEDLMLSARRATASALLLSLADEARGFRSVAVSVRTQAQVADAFWESDQGHARALFRRAWEAAEAADTESQKLAERPNATGPRATPSNLRGEVLLLAQLRDPALAEEFLAKLDTDKERREGNDKAAGPRPQICPGPTEQPPPAFSQRLALATQVLATGEVNRALQFAGPVLGCATLPSLHFLTTLRAKAPQAADQAYASMLASAESDPSSDANTVSLLSSYVLTPMLFITVGRRGNFNTSAPPTLPPAPELSPALRTAFFRTAARILMRPLPPPDQDRTSAGRAGTYFVIKRLLPLFEQYAPETAVTLNAFLSSMTSDVSEGFRSGRSEWLTKGLVPENRGDDAHEALGRVERVSSASERDAIYANAALQVYKEDYPRALELLAKIGDTDLRQRMRAFIDFNAVIQAAIKGEAAELVRLARDGELTPFQRVVAYTEAAGVKKKPETLRDVELLDEALNWARRIDNASPDRARALVAIATRAFKADGERAWAIMPEVVKAANAVDNFTGTDSRISAELRAPGTHSVSDHRVTSFRLSGIFKDLGRSDMNRAVELARSFAGESPRSVSLIAIARAVLEEKPKAQAKGQG